MELIAFTAANEYMGMEAQYIRRIVGEFNLTPVPLVPAWYKGLIYYRGEVFDVIHVGSLLKGGEAAYDENTRLIIVKWATKKLALIPDLIIGLVWAEDIKDVKASCDHSLLPVDCTYPESIRLPRGTKRSEEKVTERGEQRGYAMRLITPEYIWKKTSGLSCGPHKV